MGEWDLSLPTIQAGPVGTRLPHSGSEATEVSGDEGGGGALELSSTRKFLRKLSISQNRRVNKATPVGVGKRREKICDHSDAMARQNANRYKSVIELLSHNLYSPSPHA